MLEPLPVWKSTLSSLPQVDKSDWVGNFASWANERSSMKLEIMPVKGGMKFTFNQGVFESTLRTAMPVDLALSAATKFSTAWFNAMMASTMVVLPGSSLAAPSPATTWSVVAGTLIDPPSIIAGRIYLMTKLTSAAPVDKGMMSHLAEAFRTAFSMVTCTVTGINSLPIPSPLIGPFLPSH